MPVKPMQRSGRYLALAIVFAVATLIGHRVLYAWARWILGL